MSAAPNYPTNERTLHVDGLVNARDLGGLARRDGSTTPRGVFYRAENVDLIQGEGWEQLRAAGIRTVVDLRQPHERATDGQPRPQWLHTIRSDLDGRDNEVFWTEYLDRENTALYYLPHLAVMPERASEALAAIALAPEGGVVFHCKSGRDRTGLISLLLLAAADAEPEAIIDDYMETVRRGEARGARIGKANPEPALDLLCQTYGTTTEGAFRSVVGELEYSDFVAKAGFSSAVRTALSTWRGHITD